MWELSHDATADDAAFIALAEALEIPGVTWDARLAHVPGSAAAVEVFPGG
jgi:predicted nucleic acid-binding protein